MTHLQKALNASLIGPQWQRRGAVYLYRVQDLMAFRFSNPNQEQRINEKNLKKKSIIIKIANTHKKIPLYYILCKFA